MIEMKKGVQYSQNFLVDKNLIADLVGKTSITQNDIVLDIGAGEGIITGVLSERCGRVIAIEIDPDLFDKLGRRFTQIPSVELNHDNFLTYSLPTTNYKVFSNIPFNISADVIKKLTTAHNPPKDTYLIMQKEAAKKFSGQPLGNETQASLAIKPWFEPSVVYQFRREDFRPIPQVDIVLWRLLLRDKPFIDDANIYIDFISFAFSQWRPSLEEGLKAIFTRDQFTRLANDLGFPLQSTPTRLSFDQWLGLYRYFLIGVNNHKKQVIVGAASKLLSQQEGLQKIHRTRVAKNWRGSTHN